MQSNKKSSNVFDTSLWVSFSCLVLLCFLSYCLFPFASNWPVLLPNYQTTKFPKVYLGSLFTLLLRCFLVFLDCCFFLSFLSWKKSCLGMHLFGGKFCTKNDGSGEVCSCQDLLKAPSFNFTTPFLSSLDLSRFDVRSSMNTVRLPNDSLLVTREFEVPFCVCDRKNFNNFLWATLTVFQVRSKEREKGARVISTKF